MQIKHFYKEKSMYKKIGTFLLYASIATIIYVYSGVILEWMELATFDTIPIVILIATLMALFPIIPYPLIGGIIGVAYGPIVGGSVTWVGSTLASIIMFSVVRYGFQDWGARILYKQNTIGKGTLLFEKNAFLAILFSRLIPIIPSIIINIYSALSRVTFIQYSIASALGKIPAMLLFALLGDQVISNPRNIITTILIYATFLGIIYLFYSIWKKNNPRISS
jgi:uncharacterized membrane protein YdjX (TVP38/TMEM64 family)